MAKSPEASLAPQTPGKVQGRIADRVGDRVSLPRQLAQWPMCAAIVFAWWVATHGTDVC
jgi:hypothetical protein